MKRAWLLFFFAGLLLLSLSIVTILFFINTPLFAPYSKAKVVIHFNEGMSANALVPLLSEQHTLRSPLYFSLYLRFLASNSRYQAGIYQLPVDITPKQLELMLVEGKVLKQSLTIKEGQTASDVFKALRQNSLVTPETKIQLTLLKNCLLCRHGMEGMFLADTYFYPAGSNESALLLRANKALVEALNRAWFNRQNNLPYKTPYELLIAASIVEKETADSLEKNLVSAVIVNRLKKNMRLQMDPTVIYGLGERYVYPLTRKDLRFETKYNTYRNKGLPPTPICNVGVESLIATAHPKRVKYLYFVAKVDGTHQFSETLKQQINAINRQKKQ